MQASNNSSDLGSLPPAPSITLHRSLRTPQLSASSLRARSSTPNLQVSYHKPTSPAQRTAVPSSEITSNPANSSLSVESSTSNPSHMPIEIDITTCRSTSPSLPYLYQKSPPGLRSYASSPSLEVSPGSTSVGTPPSISPSCSDMGICVDSQQHDEYPPVPESSASNSRPIRPTSSRTFIAPGVDLTFQELVEAQNITLYNQEAQAVRFGDLFRDQKTIVIFIRHFLCPFCADYMRAIVRQVNPRVLARSNVKLLVVSHGSPYMIKSYRSIFALPYPVYTDPSRKIYRALNMTLRTLSGGPKSERGDYLEHNLTLGLLRVAKNAVKARMPLYRYPGDFFQVGGEFVLGPGLQCSYVSRMYNTATHAPIDEVVRAAGVDSGVPLNVHANWEKLREEELERIRQRKGLRRGLYASPNFDTEVDQAPKIETLESVDITHIRELLDATRQLSL